MFKKNKTIVQPIIYIVIGITIILLGIFLPIKSAMQNYSGILLGIGSGIFGGGIANMLEYFQKRKNSDAWKKVDIERNDERNKFLHYKIRSTIYGINIYIISFLVIVGLLTNLPIWAPLFLAGLQLFNMVLYVWLFNKNNKAN